MLTHTGPGAVRRLSRVGLIGCALAALAGTPVRAAGATRVPLAVLPLKLLDTSGEPTDQAARHARRLARLTDEIAADLTGTGLYRASVVPAENLGQDCPTGQAACLL